MLRLRAAALLFFCFCFFETSWSQNTALSGQVRAHGRSAVANALVVLVRSPQTIIASTHTDAGGHFTLLSVPRGSYILRVQAPGFTEARLAVEANQAAPALRIDLDIATSLTEITVTGERGSVEETFTATQQVNVITADELAVRAKSVIAQAAQEEEGVHLQRTSPTVSGVYIRGLTGNRVNVYVDGVRYSNSAQRGGINTFFNMNQASGLDAIELIRGASSAQYGSDAIGGSVQLIGVAPALSDTPLWSGRYSLLGASADASFGSNLLLNFGTRRFAASANLDGLRSNRLRPGGGVDSHSAFARFFGLPSRLFIGPRLPDTAFTQYGGSVRTVWTISEQTNLTANYSRSQQDGGRRYDQLLGGDGNLIADLRNLMTDLLYIRLDKLRVGAIDRLNLTYSYNVQREERVNQGGNGNPNASITHEPERMRVHGVQGFLDKIVGGHDLIAGGEYYQERIAARSHSIDPVSGIFSIRRGRVPDNAQYRSGGIYLQDVYSPFRQVTLSASVRYSRAAYESRQSDSPIVNEMPLWPNDSFDAGAWTYRLGAMYSPVEPVALFFNIARGFRAPHITDLGTLGLTGSGFEVAAPDISGLNATLGTSASRTATSSGLPVVQLKPEYSQSYDFGFRTRTKYLTSTFSAFINDINDSITKQALILPQGAVGSIIAGVPITAQDPTGTVFVAASSSPVLVRANWDDARIWGLEHRSVVRFNERWSVGALFTYIHAADKRSGLAPNFEGGTPAPDGYFRIRYNDPRGRFWFEPYMHVADRQDRLSSLDIEDRRTGATRSRSSIQNFFRRGATVRGYVSPGLDGTFGNADDVLSASGETLAQIQSRVLGAATQAPLYDHVPGYVTFNLRGGLRFAERHTVVAELENIGDRNYRGISWGIDAPGRSFTARYSVSF